MIDANEVVIVAVLRVVVRTADHEVVRAAAQVVRSAAARTLVEVDSVSVAKAT
jgi:hypothetical protein